MFLNFQFPPKQWWGFGMATGRRKSYEAFVQFRHLAINALDECFVDVSVLFQAGNHLKLSKM